MTAPTNGKAAAAKLVRARSQGNQSSWDGRRLQEEVRSLGQSVVPAVDIRMDERLRGVFATTAASLTLPSSTRITVCDCRPASLTITLPAARQAPGISHTIILGQTTAATRKLTITAKGTDMIAGTVTSGDLFVAGESVTLVSDGQATWWLVDDVRYAHACRLERAAAQSIPNTTLTVVELDTAALDPLGLGTSLGTATASMTIRRSGTYRVSGDVTIPNLDSGEHVRAVIEVAGTDVRQSRGYVSAAGVDGSASAGWVGQILAGQIVRLKIRHDEGAAQSTPTSLEQRPMLHLHEVFH